MPQPTRFLTKLQKPKICGAAPIYLLQREREGELRTDLRHPNNLLTHAPPRPAHGGACHHVLPRWPSALARLQPTHHIPQQLQRQSRPSALLSLIVAAAVDPVRIKTEIDGRCRGSRSISPEHETSSRKASDPVSYQALQRHDSISLPLWLSNLYHFRSRYLGSLGFWQREKSWKRVFLCSRVWRRGIEEDSSISGSRKAAVGVVVVDVGEEGESGIVLLMGFFFSIG